MGCVCITCGAPKGRHGSCSRNCWPAKLSMQAWAQRKPPLTRLMEETLHVPRCDIGQEYSCRQAGRSAAVNDAVRAECAPGTVSAVKRIHSAHPTSCACAAGRRTGASPSATTEPATPTAYGCRTTRALGQCSRGRQCGGWLQDDDTIITATADVAPLWHMWPACCQRSGCDEGPASVIPDSQRLWCSAIHLWPPLHSRAPRPPLVSAAAATPTRCLGHKSMFERMGKAKAQNKWQP